MFLAPHNSCMKLHVFYELFYERFFSSDHAGWTLARVALVAVPLMLGLFALALLVSSLN